MSRFEFKAKVVQKFPQYMLFNFRNPMGTNHNFVFENNCFM